MQFNWGPFAVAFFGRCLLLVLLLTTVQTAARGQANATKKIPPPEDIELKDKNGSPMTRDGLLLKATYYPGTRKDKTVPIIMLHGYKGNRTEFADLAALLQKDHGHAVLVPDMRGHGDSTKNVNSTKALDAAKLGPDDFDLMVSDMEACKRFLMEKNNAGELNIERLCIIGSEMGAVVAMNWSVVDWSWPILATGKQGQDVKALVLLSPQFQVERGRLSMAAPTLSPLQKELAVALFYGSVTPKRFGSDAKRIQSALDKWHTESSPQPFYFEEVKTSLQGTKMLNGPGLPLKEVIAKFITMTVVERDLPWRERLGPLN